MSRDFEAAVFHFVAIAKRAMVTNEDFDVIIMMKTLGDRERFKAQVLRTLNPVMVTDIQTRDWWDHGTITFGGVTVALRASEVRIERNAEPAVFIKRARDALGMRYGDPERESNLADALRDLLSITPGGK